MCPVARCALYAIAPGRLGERAEPGKHDNSQVANPSPNCINSLDREGSKSQPRQKLDARVITMSIAVTCSCGKQFRVKDEHAGKRTTCPFCKQPLSIPGKSSTPPEAA